MSKKFVNQRWRTSEKMKLVAESWHLNDEALGQFLRQNGLHNHDLNTWKEQMVMGMDGNKPLYGEERRYYKDKIKKLEKRLKESEAIIELQKKVKNLISGAEAQKPQKKSDDK